MLSVLMLNAIKLNVIMLNIIILKVIKQNVIWLNVMAHLGGCSQSSYDYLTISVYVRIAPLQK
jgi:hypothetical protein